MDVLDKILKENSWKFPKGYPDINDKGDKDLLQSIINNYLTEAEEEVELGDDKEVLNIKKDDNFVTKLPGGNIKYDDTIRYTVYQGNKWQDQPIPRPKKKYAYQNGTFTINVAEEDMPLFSTLYKTSPPKVNQPVGSAPSKGIGNGELALYWLYRFSESAKVETGGTSGAETADAADLFFGGKGVEVKAWDKHAGMHGLGRFGEDKNNLALLSIIMGFNALATLLGEGAPDRTINPTNFSGQDLVGAYNNVLLFKRLVQDDALVSQYDLFKTIKTNLEKLYKDFELEDGDDATACARKTATKICTSKLERKPGDKNHLVNVLASGEMKFFNIDFKKLEGYEGILNDFRVSQSAIKINFNNIWG